MATTRTTKKRRAAPKKGAAPKKKAAKPARKWSAKVMRESDALDLQPNIFKARDPEKIARSLKRSAEVSKRTKASPYQSAMSMLNFYINRGGKNLSAARKRILESAKAKLRQQFGRE
jgi:hypothetical protein